MNWTLLSHHDAHTLIGLPLSSVTCLHALPDACGAQKGQVQRKSSHASDSRKGTSDGWVMCQGNRPRRNFLRSENVPECTYLPSPLPREYFRGGKGSRDGFGGGFAP